jgi:hypothetical protein
MEEVKKACNILVGNAGDKAPLGKLKRKWKIRLG